MKLKIWTAADTQGINKTYGRTLKGMKPPPPHEFLPYVENQEPPIPEQGEVILVCGDKTLDVLRQAKIAHKGKKIGTMRETPLSAGEGKGYYMCTYDPGVLGGQPELGQMIDWDVRLATRLLTTGSLKPQIGNYKWVNSFQPMIEEIKKRYAATGKPVEICGDTEADTFYPWYPDRDLVTLQFTLDEGTAEVMYIGNGEMPVPMEEGAGQRIYEELHWLCTSPMVKQTWANGKFDMVWLAEKCGIECNNFTFDPILAGNLLDENRSNSLNTLCKIKTQIGGYDDEFNDKYDKGKLAHYQMVEPFKSDFLTYAGGDTDGGLRAARVIREELMEEPDLANFYKVILHPAARSFERIERRGVCIDVEKFKALSAELEAVKQKSRKAMLNLLPNKMLIKHREKIDDQLKADKNPLTPSILKEFFFTPHGLNLKPKMFTPKPDKEGNKVPSTAAAHLKMFKQNLEAKAFLEVMQEGNSADKTKSTFVDGFLKHIRPDGRLHPIYMLFHGALNDDEDDDDSGSTTGRLSAKEPPIQVTPKKTKWAKRIRECMIAPPGKVIIAFDYSQGELRVVACIAHEENMIQSYLNGMDLHAVTGARLGEMSYEDFQLLKTPERENLPWDDAPFEANNKTLKGKFDYLRDRAKPANFGLLYGMSAEGLVAYAWAQYNLALDIDEAVAIREMFFKLYPGLLKYHQQQKNIVKNDLEVRGPLGRIRHLPHIKSWAQDVRAQAERRAINAPVQSTLTDMMIWAISLIDKEFNQEKDVVQVFAMIHDAIYAYVDEDVALQIAPQVQHIMSNLPFDQVGWEPQLQFLVDAEIGPDLAHLEKLKIAV